MQHLFAFWFYPLTIFSLGSVVDSDGTLRCLHAPSLTFALRESDLRMYLYSLGDYENAHFAFNQVYPVLVQLVNLHTTKPTVVIDRGHILNMRSPLIEIPDSLKQPFTAFGLILLQALFQILKH